MVELSLDTIEKSCKQIRLYFPPTFVIEIFAELIDDNKFTYFPNLKLFKENIEKSNKSNLKIPLKVIKELSSYFYSEQDMFLTFLKNLTSQGIKHEILNKILLDEFIFRANTLLIKDSDIRIENYELIQKWLPNRSNKDIFLNINVPDYIQDYLSEGLDCMYHNLHRSSILFCTIALEASLRFKYSELVEERNAYKINFSHLINWGISNNLIEENDFNKVNINFIRKYRNDLAHCNMNKPLAKEKISRIYAQKMSNIIVYLVELFINNMFY